MEAQEITLDQEAGRRVMAARLATGLVQGLLLYWLYAAHRDVAWPATEAYLMVPLTTLLLIAPVLLISSLGHLAPRQTVFWLLAAAGLLIALALHDVWRGLNGWPLLANWEYKPVASPSSLLVCFSGVFFFIAHTVVLAGARQGRRIAGYHVYFETSWKLAIQLLFSAFFVGALFLVLMMGAQLFMLVKLRFLFELLQKSWFNVPVVCAAFSCALHITDVRPSIVRGIRTLLLVLLSWILPVAVVLVTGFLCTLPFTGLSALWETRHATSVLLSAAAVLLVLVNAAFQNGEAVVALPLRVSARTAAILILPLVMVGIYALGLRVIQYGWSSDRVIAAACLLVASFYAAGYLWAAYQYDTWLAPLTTVNVAAALLILVVLLALFTPLADPARIGVNSQMARLEKGKTAADKFDFHYLRFEGGRYGRAALEKLKQQASGADAALLRREAAAALALEDKARWNPQPRATAPVSVASNLTVWPSGAQLPASFLTQKWDALKDSQKPDCLTQREGKCDAFIVDLNGDGKPEVLLVESPRGGSAVFSEGDDGGWTVIARMAYRQTVCQPLVDKLRQGDYRPVAPRLKELEVGGERVGFEPVLPEGGNCEKFK